MAFEKRLICASSDLRDAGNGYRFVTQDTDGNDMQAFVIRHNGDVFGYLNRCAHIQVELDWQHGQFFDEDSELLICATHGASYLPDTGECIGGPCKGAFLTKLKIVEDQDRVYLLSSA